MCRYTAAGRPTVPVRSAPVGTRYSENVLRKVSFGSATPWTASCTFCRSDRVNSVPRRWNGSARRSYLVPPESVDQGLVAPKPEGPLGGDFHQRAKPLLTDTQPLPCRSDSALLISPSLPLCSWSIA